MIKVHYITGTASLLPARPEAAATASVSLVAAGIAHAIVCSIPGVPRLINRLACKRGFL